MSEFTKGPWKAIEWDDGSFSIHDQNDDPVIHLGKDDRIEDARLIAAAPDMYEALRELVNSECSFFNSAIESDHLFDFIEWRDRAILSLRKANGLPDAPGA